MRALTESQLIEGLEHIRYEHLMLRDTAVLLDRQRLSRVLDRAEQVQRNVLVESFAVHARVLYCFLWVPVKYDDDIVARDYVTDWPASPKGASDDVRNVFKMTSKRIVHLSLDRQHYEARDDLRNWDVRHIWDQIHPAMVTFYSSPRVVKLEAQRQSRHVPIRPSLMRSSVHDLTTTTHTSSYDLEPLPQYTPAHSIAANPAISLAEQLRDPFKT